jgi:hypothetical protein
MAERKWMNSGLVLTTTGSGIGVAKRSAAVYPDWDTTYWALVPAGINSAA